MAENQEQTNEQAQEPIENTQENTLETDTSENENTEVNTAPSLEEQLADAKDKYLRLYADFENFRRRTAKEKVDIIQNASEKLIIDILPVIDDFERANKSFESTNEIEALKEGITLIYQKLHKTLASKGVKVMEAENQDFDADLHECITQFAAGDDKKGKVIDVVEKGYFLNDKVIRYAKVVVGN